MNLRRITTESSVWVFDLDNMRYQRFPAVEAPQPTNIPYTDGWDTFTRLEDMGNGHMMVHRPVPFGTGALRQTGIVVADTGQGNWPIVEEDEDDADPPPAHPVRMG